MRILIVSDGVYPYSMGGSHRMIYEMAISLMAVGHKVTCVVPEIGRHVPIALEGTDPGSAGIRVLRFRATAGGLVRKAAAYFTGFLRPVEKALEEEGADVVNVHYLPALISLRKLVSRGMRIHYTFHGPWAAEYRQSFSGRMDGKPAPMRLLSRWLLEPLLEAVASRLEGYCLRRCHRFMVISDYMRGMLRDRYGIPEDRITVIPSGVNHASFFPEDADALRQRLSGGRSRVFLTVRRLEKRMGIDILIRAAAILREDYPDFMLLIGGKGIQREYLEDLIRSTGCGENVRMLGFIPEGELRHHLCASDLFILPSRDLEGFGLVVLEAMACGVPVLVSPRGGPPEVVGRFDPNFVLQNLNPRALADKLRSLIESGALGGDVSRRCVDFVKAGYSWERFSSQYLEWAGRA